MLIEEIEIVGDLTEEKESKLKELFRKCIIESEVKWVGIECINNDDSLSDTLITMKEIIELLISINSNLFVITATITGSVEDNETPEKIKIKLFDNKPKVTENIIN